MKLISVINNGINDWSLAHPTASVQSSCHYVSLIAIMKKLFFFVWNSSNLKHLRNSELNPHSLTTLHGLCIRFNHVSVTYLKVDLYQYIHETM